jgi:two-component system phosphate regulon sensor histidine kinase PhoR
MHVMKTSARLATIFIFLFFIFFNGVQVYLIVQRLAAAKEKFNTAASNALQATLFQYNKIKSVPDTARPAPGPNLNRPPIIPLDLTILSSIYASALDTSNIHSAFRLDTFPIPFKTGDMKKDLAGRANDVLLSRRTKAHPVSTNAQRIFFYPTTLIFAELKYDYNFFGKELLWPLLAFALVILISNIALFFVYRTIRRQKRINEVKTDFINNMTHEMKTPITIGLAGLEALEHHVPAGERIKFYLDTSKKQLHLLNEFVERILDAAVQDISDFTLRKEKLDLHALFTDLIKSHSVIDQKPVSFHLSGNTPVFIQGDPLHLETAFHNIIDNAIKYSNGSVEINIDLVDSSRDCIIKIRDNGRGIPPQFVKNVFEKFFRVPQGDSQTIKGFGLGLYYVANIVKKHGGSISANSKLQSGTEFVITLPKNA